MATEDNIIELKFSDSKIPEFKEVRGEEYVRFGNDDKYPEYLLGLLNKSAKHNAIVKGKVDYIFGGGLTIDGQDLQAEEFKKNLSNVDKQTLTDIEVFGGFYWQVIPKMGGGFKICHVDFKSIRSNSDGSVFYYKKDWSDRSEEKKIFPAFHRDLTVSSIFAFREYRPGNKVYPLPGYVASCNYIEADVEVSKATLTNAKTGFSATKFINFYNGEPNEEGKRDINRRFEHLNTGSEGKKIIIAFNQDPAKKPTIDDLGVSDLTKEDFTAVDTLITNNIFSGAQITHPLLFGIQQEGKLGGATELRTAFDIFKNTYVNGKQKQFEEIVNFFARLKGISAKFKLQDVDPIGFEFSEATMLAVAPRSWMLEKMGIDPKLYPDTPVSAGPQQLGTETVNDNIKNLTAKQHQQLLRIVRDYTKGRVTRDASAMLLKTSLNLSEEEINVMLGEDQSFASDDQIAYLFETHGEIKDSYEIFRTSTATFKEDDEAFEMMQAFDDLREKKETVPPTVKNRPPAKINIPKFMIRYSYEVRSGEGSEVIKNTRPFCRKMIGLNKFYSREDIQRISSFLGYNVFERVGGFWNDNGVIKPHCRHEWKANIVVRK